MGATTTGSGDPALPHLRTAWDGERMRELFERSLQPPGGTPLKIESCRVARFRYREGLRCIAHYEVTLDHSRTKDAGGIRWVTGLMYAGGKNAGVERDLRRCLVQSERGCNNRLGLEPTGFIPELGMHVQVFPFDRYLPRLPVFVAGPPPELRRALEAAFGRGNWSLQDCRVSTVRYRPLQGATLRYVVQARDGDGGRTEQRTFYVKLYRNGADDRAYDIVRSLERAAADRRIGFDVAPVVARCESQSVLVMGAASGTSLDRLVAQGHSITAAAVSVATALATLHTGDIATLRVYGHDEFVAQARRAGTLIQWAYPAVRNELAKLVDVLQRVPREPLSRPVHGDLKGDHVFLDGDRVSIIDFDNFAAGEPMIDAAMMTARLATLSLTKNVDEVDAGEAADAFIGRYLSLVPESWGEKFAPCYAHALLQIALYCVRHQEKDWRNKLESLLHRATSVISMSSRIGE